RAAQDGRGRDSRAARDRLLMHGTRGARGAWGAPGAPHVKQGVTHMTDGKGPLHGIRVIDLGRHQAGPRCAQVLARLGAEVIKIERLGGEETRYHAPWVRKQSAYWVQYNSGKKSVSMDSRKEEAKAALRKLIKMSDVVVQN